MAATASSAAPLLFASSPAAALQQLTAACDSYEATGAKDAEACLIAFRSRPSPFELTRHALQHSSSARVLHLSLATHTAALTRLWQWMAPTDRQREADALLWFASERAASQQSFVLSQSAHVAAVLLRRCWLDGGSSADRANERCLHTVDRLLAARTLSSVRVAVEIVQSLVGEMSLSCRSYVSLGVSAVSVVAAHTSFERLCLLPLFARVLHLMRSLLASSPTSSDRADVLLRCARAVEGCLEWHFQVDDDTALRYLSSAGSETETAALPSQMRPPLEWRSVLLESDVLDVLVQCDRELLSGHRRSLDVLSCLLPLSSLGGAVFAEPRQQWLFVDSLIRHTCCLLELHQQRSQQYSQQLDGSLFSVVHSVLVGAMSGVSLRCLLAQPSFTLWLSCLAHMTRSVLQDESFTRSTFTSGTDTTLAEALHAMLATWAELAMAVHEQRETNSEEQHVSSSKRTAGTVDSISKLVLDSIEQHGTQIAALYVSQRLEREVSAMADSSKERAEEDEESEEQFAGADNEQEQLVSIGFLARLQPVGSLMQYLSLLARLIQSYSMLLSSTVSSGTSTSSMDTVSCCERLLLLVDLLSCIVTDSAQGEASAIPSMLLSGLPDSIIVDSLVHSALNLLSLMVDTARAGHGCRLSPTLAVSVFSLLARVNAVYVDVDTAQSLYSLKSPARHLLLSLACVSRTVSVHIDAAHSFLSLWTGEPDVHNAALQSLLPLIAQHRSRVVAVASAGYVSLWQLLQSTGPPPNSSSTVVALTVVDRLSSSTQSLLACVLSRSCDDDRAVMLLWSPIRSRLSYVMQQAANSWLSNACNVVYCTSAVSLLCGASDSTSAATFDASFALLSSHWSDLTHLLRAAVVVPSAAPVVSAILSLLVSSAEHQLSYMDSSQSSRFMALCADMVGHFLHSMQQRAATLQPAVQRIEAELLVESYEEDMTLLLRLLSELVGDDTWSAGVDTVERAGQLCVMAVTTLTSDGLFMQVLAASALSSSSSPSSLVSLFFSLLHDALTTHTARVAELPSAVRARLLSLLLHAPPQVSRQCLQCVTALAAYHAKQRSAVQAQLADDVSRMLHWLLVALISRPVHSALLEPFSDALLACCVAVPHRIGQLATAAVDEWQQQRRQQRSQVQSESDERSAAAEQSALQSSIARLVTSNGLRADLSMDNKRKMRANVRHYANTLAVSRGVV